MADLKQNSPGGAGMPLFPVSQEDGLIDRQPLKQQNYQPQQEQHQPSAPFQSIVPQPMKQNFSIGLDCLLDLDHVVIEQQRETLEFISNIEAANTYLIKAPSGQLIFTVEEHSTFLARNCVGKSRPFTLKLLSPARQEVLLVQREFKCALFACCSAKCLEHMDVTAPNGAPFGAVDQVWRPFGGNMYFALKDEFGDARIRIKAPTGMNLFSNRVFEVVDEKGNQVGEIKKKWAGFAQEFFTQADNFAVFFPVGLDAKMKALMIVATFLLDFIYYENN